MTTLLDFAENTKLEKFLFDSGDFYEVIDDFDEEGNNVLRATKVRVIIQIKRHVKKVDKKPKMVYRVIARKLWHELNEWVEGYSDFYYLENAIGFFYYQIWLIEKEKEGYFFERYAWKWVWGERGRIRIVARGVFFDGKFISL